MAALEKQATFLTQDACGLPSEACWLLASRQGPSTGCGCLLPGAGNRGAVVLVCLETSFLFFLLCCCCFNLQQEGRNSPGWIVPPPRMRVWSFPPGTLWVTILELCDLEQGPDARLPREGAQLAAQDP